MTDIFKAIRILILSFALVVTGISLTGADTVRGHHVPSSRSGHSSHSSGGHHGGGYYPHYYRYGVGVSYYYLPYYYGGWGYYWGAPYPAYYPAAYPAPYYARDVAYLDTDVSPEKARVYLDGQFMGVADDFDGFPQYLAVEPGKHVVRFEMEGRMSVTRTVQVPRGTVLDLDFTLPKGSGEAPSSNGDHEIVVPEPPPQAGAAGEQAAPQEEPQGAIEQQPEEGDPGFIRLKITPPDASVYIDGKFVGSAATLSRLHGDMRVKSGPHEIEVVRPGYRAARREVRIFAGDRITVEIGLETESRP